ncbi:MAG: plasmid pRiA4b ORF-3 family protein [Sphaerochaeta sp.]|nr:plasmid pRiA4b ORF-3 family protein [Sphaerochaeta sp.]
MYIRCTKKLFDCLDPSYRSPASDHDPEFSWHASCYEDYGTLYVSVLHDLDDEDLRIQMKTFQFFDGQVEHALHLELKEDGYSDKKIAEYFKDTGPITFVLTDDHELETRLDDHIQLMKDISFLFSNGRKKLSDGAYEKALTAVMSASFASLEEVLERPLYKRTSSTKTKSTKKTASFSSLNAGSTRMLALDVSMVTGFEKSVTRSFLVPLVMDFATLHAILQIGFGWTDSSEHEFKLKNGAIRIGSDRGDMYFRLMWEGIHPEVHVEGETLLSDFIPGVRKIKYLYGFDRGWLLDITVKKAPDFDGGPYAQCTGGQGTTPPEDCGGPPGYDELCEILDDPTHDEYAETHQWVQENPDTIFDMKRINAKLKKLKFVDTTR